VDEAYQCPECVMGQVQRAPCGYGLERITHVCQDGRWKATESICLPVGPMLLLGGMLAGGWYILGGKKKL